MRFSPQDIAWLSMWVSMTHGGGGSCRGRLRPPQAPPQAQQREIEARCTGFAPSRPQLPWWAQQVSQHRDAFSGVAFGALPPDADDLFPPQVFVATLLSQRPTSVYGMIASLRPLDWSRFDCSSSGASLEFAGRPFYQMSEGVHVSASAAGFSDDDSIVVFEGLRHVSGGILVVSPPVPLEHFVCMRPRAGGRQPGQSGQPRARPTACGNLPASGKYWEIMLSGFLFRRVCRVRAVGSRSQGLCPSACARAFFCWGGSLIAARNPRAQSLRDPPWVRMKLEGHGNDVPTGCPMTLEREASVLTVLCLVACDIRKVVGVEPPCGDMACNHGVAPPLA